MMLHSVFRQMVRLPKNFSKRIQRVTPLTLGKHLRGQRQLARSGACSLVLIFSLIVAGCATAPEDTSSADTKQDEVPEVVEAPKQSPTAVEEVPAKDQPVTAQPDGQAEIKQPEVGEMITVSVYTIDDQCNDFVEESVEVPSDKAMWEAVGKAMSAVDYNAFKLEGYEVSVDGSTAVVDMQLAPNSERQFVSLSSCEQRALFGSVEETLLNNPDWDVDAVKFTDSGKELIL